MTDPQPEDCPVARTARLIGDTWTLLILRDLIRGSKRFGELAESLGGISPKTLSQRLKALESAEIVTRCAYAEVPPRVVYALSDRGWSLVPIIEALRAFGEQYDF